MTEPILIIMAAGMGSRYGGLKQIDPVGPAGEIIMDYAVYDAVKAGFKRVIFVIKDEIREAFEEKIGGRLRAQVKVDYAFQHLDDLPAGFTLPTGRVKPWGTGQAVLAARDLIDQPFAVLNADDYYGPEAYARMYDYLAGDRRDREVAMCTWRLNQTTSPHGHVARGVCELDEAGFLKKIVERTRIVETGDGNAQYQGEDQEWHFVSGETPVSMNFWGFPVSLLSALEEAFPRFLEDQVRLDPLKAEFLLPTIVDGLLKTGQARVRTFPVADRWFGVTYREDKPLVEAELRRLTAAGVYPSPLWGQEHS